MQSAAANLAGVVDNLLKLMRPFVSILIGIALVYFLWGLSQFILASGDKTKVEEGKKTMLWGIIALFVMISIQGIVYLVANSFEIRDSGLNVDTYIEP
ncbi:MAG: hypothetical protein A2749_00765 [Parcubacteria group bacterium RIFCSPHIGHO2_01_FULL_45_26]|nr:MAG: hypothetical protein A2749_00765 [Parcubacteria group bacterium RIFCSPHIGHO2_01_FULL_45_26]